MVIGQRWDLDVSEPLGFEAEDWENQLRVRVTKGGSLHAHTGIDYFVFPRGMWGNIPPFAIGRTAWDNWLIYRARALGARVIDATEAVKIVHQNHDYVQGFQDLEGVRTGPEGQINRKLAGWEGHIFTLNDADWMLTPQGLVRPPLTAGRLRRSFETLFILSPRLDPWYKRARKWLSLRRWVRGGWQRVRYLWGHGIVHNVSL